METPPPFNMGNSIFMGDDLHEWWRTLTKYLQLGALRPTAHATHISQAFMALKPDGTKQLIIDL